MSPAELELLTSPARPIVILPRKNPSPVAPSVAPGNPTLGVMLAYTPLHHLLLDAFGGPLVMTSGNVSDEPIAFLDDDAARRLASIADGFLVHDRAIRTRVDDSVVKVVRDRVVPLRRSRGYVPSPIALPFETSEVVLGMGAGLKNTFCIARGRHAFVSHHIGDLENYETFQSYVDGIAHFIELLDVIPTVIAHDLHPDYPSTVYADELAERFGARLVGVQHHHAHIASCLVDNGVTGPVIGVAFDGLGLGCDQHAWGGEFLVADLDGFERAAHFAEVPMPGGDAAVRAPWRMALSHLDAAYPGAIPPQLGVVPRNAAHWDAVLSLSRSDLAPLTSSAGRLFDAVSSLLGIRDEVTYEGQAAIELEYAADPTELGSYPVPVRRWPAPGQCAGPSPGRRFVARRARPDLGRPLPQLPRRRRTQRLRSPPRGAWSRHRRPLRRRLPELAAADPLPGPPRTRRVHRPDPPPSPPERRRHQPRPVGLPSQSAPRPTAARTGAQWTTMSSTRSYVEARLSGSR